jgi:hypothetical protein
LDFFSFHFESRYLREEEKEFSQSVKISIEIDDVHQANMCEKRNDDKDLATHSLRPGKKRKMG